MLYKLLFEFIVVLNSLELQWQFVVHLDTHKHKFLPGGKLPSPRLEVPENRDMQNLSAEHGTWQKIKVNKGTSNLSCRDIHVQILMYFCILTIRVLDSVLGLHDSTKLGWKINSYFPVQRLAVGINSSCITKWCLLKL